MSGYHDPSRSFSVEPYKGAWIQRAVLPGDLPADSHPDAVTAVRYWLASNRRKHHKNRTAA